MGSIVIHCDELEYHLSHLLPDCEPQWNAALELDGFSLPKSSLIYLFFFRINMDPRYWLLPREIDFGQDFSEQRGAVFGGSQFTFIGRALTMHFLGRMFPQLLCY